MATIQQNGSAVVGNYLSGSTKNNRGVVVNAGSSTGTVGKVNLGSTQVATGSKVVNRETTDAALSGGTFAYNNASPVAPRLTKTISGVSNTVLLSGANQPGLLRSINKRESYRVTKSSTSYRNGNWNAYYGKHISYGTYARSGTTVTVTAANHGLTTDDFIYLDFTSGAATDGRFQVTVTNSNVFTVTHGSSGTTSGNVTLKGPATATENPGNDDAATVSRSAPGELVFVSSGGKLDRTRDYSSKTG